MSIGTIDINLDRPGLNLVLGLNLDEVKSYESNGAAKSALFEAMVWCCYGKLLRGDMTVDQVIRTDQKSLEVELIIDPEDGNECVKIYRSRTSKKATVSVSNLTSGTELFPANSATDIQQYIDTWLGADFKTFTNAVYFGKGLAKSFMAASDSDRKDLLDTILQVISFDDALASSKAKVKSLNDTLETRQTKLVASSAILELKNSELLSLKEITSNLEVNSKNQIDENNIKLNTTQLLIEELEYNLNYLTGTYNTTCTNNTNNSLILQKEKDKNSTSLDKEYLVSLSALNETKLLAITNINQTFKKQEQEIIKVEKELALESTNLKTSIQLFASNKLETSSQVNLLQKELASIKNILIPDKSCTTCKQIISKNYVDSSTKLIEEKLLIANQLHTKAVQLLTAEEETYRNHKIEVEEVTILHTKLTNKKLQEERLIENKFNLDKENLLSDIFLRKEKLNSHLSKSLSVLTEELTTLQNSYREEYVSKTGEITGNKILLKNLTRDITVLESSIKSKRLKLEELNSEVTGLARDTSTLVVEIESLKNQIEQFSFWVEAFGPKGIKSFVFETALPYITEKANYYSTKLTGGTVVIEILPTTTTKTTENIKEKLFVSAKNRLGANVYSGNSDGEKRRIDICILLALQDLISTRVSKVWNTVVFDEIFENLDKPGIINVIELLRELPGKSIFLISHKEDIKQYFDTAITVMKQHGVSSLK